MKKRILFPCLLLVSSLTACGGSGGGLVTGGQPYKDGVAQAVDPAIKAQKEGTIKTVTAKESVSVSVKISYNGQSYSVSEKISGSMVVDLEAKTMNGDFDLSVGYSGETTRQKIRFSASETNGQLIINSGAEYSSVISTSTLEQIYDTATYTVYSWNFSRAEADMSTYFGFVDDDAAMGYGEEISSFVKDLLNNLVIAGDPSTGTFDVGLAKAVTMNLEGINFSFNKFKISYKDCLLTSELLGLRGSGSIASGGQRVSISISETAEVNYSYTFRK